MVWNFVLEQGLPSQKSVELTNDVIADCLFEKSNRTFYTSRVNKWSSYSFISSVFPLILAKTKCNLVWLASIEETIASIRMQDLLSILFLKHSVTQHETQMVDLEKHVNRGSLMVDTKNEEV